MERLNGLLFNTVLRITGESWIRRLLPDRCVVRMVVSERNHDLDLKFRYDEVPAQYKSIEKKLKWSSSSQLQASKFCYVSADCIEKSYYLARALFLPGSRVTACFRECAIFIVSRRQNVPTALP